MTVMTPALSRRSFLQAITVALGAAAVGIDQFGRTPAAAVAAAGPTLPVGTPIVVVIDLAGGNDILNTIVPIAVPNVTSLYRSARPNIGLTRVTTARPFGPPPAGDYLPPALDLDGQWALHGAMPWLANRWHDRSDVAIVQGTGEDVVKEMSHFAAWAYRWAGAFTGPNMSTGWLGRYNDVKANTLPLGAVALGGLNQGLASATAPAVAINDLASFQFSAPNAADRTTWLQDLSAMADPASPGANKVAVAAKALDDARLAMATAAGVPPLAPPAGGGTLGSQLAVAASLIAAGIPCQTYTVTHGGFDDHSGEPFAEWDRLTALDAGLGAFFTLIDATSRAADVFVVLHSEFGRQVSENAGLGTDHGRASSTIIVGGGVHGGLYGTFPDLTPAARYFDAMVPTVDFRRVYATVLNRLGGDTALTDAALGRDEAGNAFADLGVFAATGGGGGTTTTTAPPTSTSTSTSSTTSTTMATTTSSSTTTTTTKPTTTSTTTTTTKPTTTSSTTTTTKPTTTSTTTTTTKPTTTSTTTTTTKPTTTSTSSTTTTVADSTTTTTMATLPAPRNVRASSPRRGRLVVSWSRERHTTWSVIVNGREAASGLTNLVWSMNGLVHGSVMTVAVVAHRGGLVSLPSATQTVTIR